MIHAALILAGCLGVGLGSFAIAFAGSLLMAMVIDWDNERRMGQ